MNNNKDLNEMEREYQDCREAEPKTPVPMMKPETCLSQNNNEIPILCSKWIVKGSQSYLVTGDQGSGKTTYLKSIMRFYPPSAALRVCEINPEMNLRFAYPYRNILEFSETAKMSTQAALDFQKKTSGTYNIIGEIATALASSWYVQTTKVASKAGAGTHHAKTVPDLISAFAMNMGGDEKIAEIMVADAIDYDIHMARENTRFCERISEITAIHTENYPYPNLDNVPDDTVLAHAIDINNQEYHKRITDRTTYTYRNICHYDRDNKIYRLDLDSEGNIFSKAYMEKILANCTTEKLKDEFYADIEKMKKIDKEGA